MSADPKKDWFSSHPRQASQCVVFMLFALWQLPVALTGWLLFVILSKILKIKWFFIVGIGVTVVIISLFFVGYTSGFNVDVLAFLRNGFYINLQLVQNFFSNGVNSVTLHQVINPYLFWFSLFFAGVLAVLDLIPNSAYEKSLRSLKKAEGVKSNEIMDEKKVDGALVALKDNSGNGTILGVSKTTLRPFIVPDKVVNQVLLVLGTTGGGKTVTLRRFYLRAVSKGYPLIIVDGKPTLENEQWVQNLAAKYDRPFYGFNCGNRDHYDCLAYGGHTELKDKIICLKDQWENDYYKSIAEDYLQTAFEVLIKNKSSFDLKTVSDCLDFDELALKVRETNDEDLMRRVARLNEYDKKDIKGLQAHLNLLIHSELGEFFEKTKDNTFDLKEVIDNCGVVYFALPALRFPSFSKVLGRLVINDIKTVIDRGENKNIFAVFDEFSIFAGGQALNLANMGRGKGLHAIFGTQGVADLEVVDKSFAAQILNCANTIICHRLNDKDGAETITGWVGTRDAFVVTAQISEDGGSSMGSVNRAKEFIIHPDDIKQNLQAGEAYYITKVDGFFQDKVKVKFS